MFRVSLADLHDDLRGKIARSRQLVDLSETLGSNGTILFGGEITGSLWHEARWSFIHGHYTSTVMLCQSLAEHILAAFLHAGLMIDLPERITFAETLRLCVKRGVMAENDSFALRHLMELRNPLSHFRNLDDPSNLSRRVLHTMQPANEHLQRDANYAISTAIKILALPAFKLN